MGVLLDRVNAYNNKLKLEEKMRLIELVENLTLDGHSNKEISEILGIPESTVRALQLLMSDERFKGLMVKHPCIGCIYFAQCGSTTRTEPCEGRMTKSEKAKMEES